MTASLGNISPDWQGCDRAEQRLIAKILKHEGTGRAIQVFAKHCKRFSDYWYWYTLGTLWVSYSGWSDLRLWRRLFLSQRPNRATSLMKPDEWQAFQQLPVHVVVYRAHRPQETDWIAYTLDPQIAARFAREREVSQVSQYLLDKDKVMALFLRRKEAEIIALQPQDAVHVRDIPVVPVSL